MAIWTAEVSMGPSGEETLANEGVFRQDGMQGKVESQSANKSPWLRPGEVLIHIGPHKTGTTALQSSLAAARTELVNAGVLYPGPRYSHYRASTQLDREPRDSGREWLELADAVHARADRAVVSSEYFDQADRETARLTVGQLGGSDARVLITLRPLHKILPGLWQQYVKNGSSKSLELWLGELLNEDRSHHLWQSLDQGKLVTRWADAVGQDCLAVLVVDAARPEGLLRDFEELVGLPPSLLRQQDSNRSLTAPEAELIRTLNSEAGILRNDLDLRKHWIRFGAIKYLVENRTPNASEPRLAMPAWAAEDLRGSQQRMIDTISLLGVHVVGDLKSLTSGEQDSSRKTPSLQPTRDSTIDLPDGHGVIENEVAIDLILGLTQKADGARKHLETRLLRERTARRVAEREAESARLDHVTGRELVNELARRSRTRVKRVLQRS